MTASGSVSDYRDTSALQSSVAAAAGVEPSAVTISVVAASVVITATIAVPASTTATAVKTALSTSLDTAAGASAQLGIPVETSPTAAIAFSTPQAAPPAAKNSVESLLEEESEGSGGSGGVAGAAAGGTVAVLLLVAGGAAVFRQRKRWLRCRVMQIGGASSLTRKNQVELGGPAKDTRPQTPSRWF